MSLQLSMSPDLPARSQNDLPAITPPDMAPASVEINQHVSRQQLCQGQPRASLPQPHPEQVHQSPLSHDSPTGGPEKPLSLARALSLETDVMPLAKRPLDDSADVGRVSKLQEHQQQQEASLPFSLAPSLPSTATHLAKLVAQHTPRKQHAAVGAWPGTASAPSLAATSLAPPVAHAAQHKALSAQGQPATVMMLRHAARPPKPDAPKFSAGLGVSQQVPSRMTMQTAMGRAAKKRSAETTQQAQTQTALAGQLQQLHQASRLQPSQQPKKMRRRLLPLPSSAAARAGNALISGDAKASMLTAVPALRCTPDLLLQLQASVPPTCRPGLPM